MTKQELLDLLAEAPAEYREALELVKTLITDLTLIDVADDSDGWVARDTSTGNDVRMTVAKLLARAIKSGTVQSLDSGDIASRPSAGAAGLDGWYLSTDEPRLYRSDGATWEAVLGTASGRDTGNAEGQVPVWGEDAGG
ncbi:hypothetical protein, partial [Natronospira sp.]|uniref:hypothetical protein n=1 Tax=Natronospira sp. TaxID=2024970 RepID=UPI00387353F1